MTEPAVTVIVPTCDGGHRHLARCLDALAAQRGAPAFETIVADSSRDETAAIPPRYPGVRHIRLPKPALGIEARGEGIRNARGRYVAFTDHDCVPEPDWLARLFAEIESRPRCMGVGGAVTNADPGNPWGTADYLLSRAWIAPWLPASFTLQLGTENALYRRELFERVRYVGVTDEPVSHGHLAREMKQHGLRAWFDPAIRVGHFNPETRAALVRHQWFHGAVAARHHINEGLWASRPVALLGSLYDRFNSTAKSWHALVAADAAAVNGLRAHSGPIVAGCCAAIGGVFELLDGDERAWIADRAARTSMDVPARRAALALLGRCAGLAPREAEAQLADGRFDTAGLGAGEAPVSSFALAIEALLTAAQGETAPAAGAVPQKGS
jgi:glycosyltransferase involved in cell wall biosynthesis